MMEEASSSEAQLAPNLTDAPFLVVYHYRQRRHSPKPRLPRPLRHPTITHSIILTRKMAAQIGSLVHSEVGTAVEDKEEKMEEEQERQFFSSGELERGIPMEDKDDGDILYNLGSLTLSQSYSKL